jgi:hypothetical protein
MLPGFEVGPVGFRQAGRGASEDAKPGSTRRPGFVAIFVSAASDLIDCVVICSLVVAGPAARMKTV